MAVIYRISFTPTSGGYGTLIEYRPVSDTTWIRPSQANPTLNPYYDISLEEGNTYDVRLSTIGYNCTVKYRYLKISVGQVLANCCPETYTLSPDETYCYKVVEVAATAPTASENAISIQNVGYSMCGSYIYSSFSTNGTGASTQIALSNSFWVNGNGDCVSGGDTANGPLNRCGIWSVTSAANQQIGFTVCIDIPESKQYYIGFGVDNKGILRVDGTTIIEQDRDIMDAQYSMVSGTSTYRLWHIYPVTLTAGEHFIELIGENLPGLGDVNPGALGAEIYDNTSAEIAAATSYEQLNLIFSTKDYIGQPIQMGTGGIGYTCPEGYALTCGAPFSCKRILTTSTQICS